MNNELIVLKTFTDSLEANLVAERLRCEGVECFLKDENTVAMANYLSQAIGSIRLVVFEKDVDQANEILNIEELSSDVNMEPDLRIRCPICKSSNVAKGASVNSRYNIIQLLISVLILFPIPFFRKQYHCFECNSEFK